ncbi:MAG TPA: hypothetical protein PLL66_06755 [Bacteroidales bacterium]|nr:hypothetical protein [Bacteroidales bacterium]
MKWKIIVFRLLFVTIIILFFYLLKIENFSIIHYIIISSLGYILGKFFYVYFFGFNVKEIFVNESKACNGEYLFEAFGFIGLKKICIAGAYTSEDMIDEQELRLYLYKYLTRRDIRKIRKEDGLYKNININNKYYHVFFSIDI